MRANRYVVKERKMVKWTLLGLFVVTLALLGCGKDANESLTQRELAEKAKLTTPDYVVVREDADGLISYATYQEGEFANHEEAVKSGELEFKELKKERLIGANGLYDADIETAETGLVFIEDMKTYQEDFWANNPDVEKASDEDFRANFWFAFGWRRPYPYCGPSYPMYYPYGCGGGWYRPYYPYPTPYRWGTCTYQGYYR
jgi:hypothetical protein